MIKIYYADISCLELSDLVFNKLSSLRKTKVNKIKSYNGKKSSAFAEILLWFAIGERAEYYYNEKGKPYFKTVPLYFNLSHSENFIACAVSDEPVGVDIQTITSRNDIIERLFSEEESKLIDDSQNKDKTFTAVWTSYEACAKLTGNGITEILKGTSRLKCKVLEKEGFIVAVCPCKGDFIKVDPETLMEFLNKVE
jgi:4'-phosphopantetheinyl transferase